MSGVIRRRGGGSGGSGTTGADGKTIITVSGAPSSGVGVNGDYAIDPTAHIFYGPKSSGVWPAGVSLIGPPGPQGDPGTGGTGGSVDLSNYPTLDQVATIEDIVRDRPVDATQATSGIVGVCPVMFPARIKAAAITSETVGISASNTNYWTFELGVWREAEAAGSTPPFTPVAVKSLQIGTESMIALYAWTFDSVAFDATVQNGIPRNVAAPRDIIGFRLTKVGNPPSLARMLYSIRTEPIR